MSTATETITTAQQLWEAGDIGRCELVRGELMMMSPGTMGHGSLANKISHYLSEYVFENELGDVFAAETGFIIETNPDTVRAPDTAFIARDRLPAEYEAGFCRIVPDLVAEVISPNDRHSEVLDKIDQWLTAGVKLVWAVDPATRTVTVYKPDRTSQQFGDQDTLTGGEVIPGFELKIAEIFK